MENNNDQVFEADQDVNAFEQMGPKSRKSDSSLHKGRDTMKAAFGVLESQEHMRDDHTPLLSRERSQSYGSREETVAGGDGRGDPSWDGERDFEGRPWWNTPSVGHEPSEFPAGSLNIYLGLLATTSLLSFRYVFWRRHRPPT